jgi:NADP-dependent 3-hydroxy acid dehydrogenase YdfG
MDQPRIVWIVGASSGIGRALAETFRAHGDTVIASSRSMARLERLGQQSAPPDGTLRLIACDVCEEQQVQAAMDAIVREFNRIDVLVNCAGVTYFKNFADTTTAEFDEVVNTNLRGLFLTTKAVLQPMIEHGGGTVMNILSYAGKVTYTGSSAYAAAKAGAEALMDVLRAETREQGIKIVNVSPGAVLTPIWNPKHQERYGHRMMKPEEVASMLFEISLQPASMMVEDVVIRPQAGDLKV